MTPAVSGAPAKVEVGANGIPEHTVSRMEMRRGSRLLLRALRKARPEAVPRRRGVRLPAPRRAAEPGPVRPAVPAEAIVAQAAAWFGTTPAEMARVRRSDAVTPARLIAAVSLRERGLKWEAVGAAIGIHHSSAMHLVKVLWPKRGADPELAAALAAVRTIPSKGACDGEWQR